MLQSYRYHQVNIAFFKADGSFFNKQVLVNNTDKTEVPYDGSQQYKAILVNHDHQDFVKVVIDDVSLEFFKANLNKIQN